MTWFTEDPRPVFVAGGIVLAVLLVLLLKTGRVIVMLAMAAVVLCLVLVAVIDRVVVTDREQVAILIEEGVAAARRNDEAAILAMISPSAPKMRDDARYWLGRIVIEDVDYYGLQVNEDETNDDLIARLAFVAQGKLKRGDTIYDRIPGRLKITFRKEGDRWMIVEYERN